MGTDANVHIEIKTGGRWLHYTRARPDRSYHMFDLIAGVRGPGPEPRGLPDDITESTRFDYEAGKTNYAATWMSSEEVVALVQEFQEMQSRSEIDYFYFEQWLGTYLYGNGFERVPKHIEDFRWVVWFDD